MAFIRVRGIPGLVYVPDGQPARLKKHNCRDCDMCQWCSDTRCGECLKRGTCGKRKPGKKT